MRMRAAAMVGREGVLGSIGDALGAARSGRGGALFLVGESGIGKSRLAAGAAELAFNAEMKLLRGRGSAVGPMVPFRSLTEALLSLMRSGEPIDLAELGPYRPILGRLVPDLISDPAAPDPARPPASEPAAASLVVLAEGVLRLTRLAGRTGGCLIVLDDLQDADAETLAVVEYLIDNLDQEPTLLLGTVRAGSSAAMNLVQAAAQRGTGTLLTLPRLGREELRTLAGSCLRGPAADVPESVVDRLWADSAGNPLLAEELLDAMVDNGVLVRRSHGWAVTSTAQVKARSTLTQSIARRVQALDPLCRELLSVAAVLGRRFPLTVVQTVTGLDDRALLNYLHGEPADQLVAPDSETPDWYAFQHPPLVEALLAALTPVERAQLSRRAADAIESIHPGLPGEWCQVSATLRRDGGEREAAGLLYAAAGRRALAQGAADSAVRLLDQAIPLLAAGSPTPDAGAQSRADALETLLYALAEAGLVERALSLADTLEQVGGGLDAQRRAQCHTRLAWAANMAGRTADGLAQVAIARSLLGEEVSAEKLAPVDVVAAHLALDVPGRDRLHTAEALVRRAATVAEAAPLPEVACQAWQLLGALTRHRDLAEATLCLERSRAIAVRHQLPIWEVHALVRLGNDDALRDGGVDRLEQARREAIRVGAVTASYQAEASLALQAALRGDFATSRSLTDQVVVSTARLKLLETTQQLMLTRAISAGHQGRRGEMEEALAEFRRYDGDPVRYASRVYGLARTFCALLEEDRPRAAAELNQAIAMTERHPTVFPLAGQHGLHLLLAALSGEHDEAALAGASTAPAARLAWNSQFVLLARAVWAGRAGRIAEMTSAVTEASQVAAPYAMSRHLGLRLIAEAAVDEGWGSPELWLRTAEEYFHHNPAAQVAGACRAMLRRAGVAVRQRRTGAETIPFVLRGAGVTMREYEVLQLLVNRLTNRQIADRLHLSPRTVEKHVASLIAKTGRPDRIALSEYASTCPASP